MVELPEAMLLAEQMDKELSGKKVLKIYFNITSPKTFFMNVTQDEFSSLVENTKMLSSYAKAKWIFSNFDSGLVLATAPEMGGDFLYHQDEITIPKKFHIKLNFDDGTFFTMKYSGFLLLKLAKIEELEAMKYPGKLGLTPLDSGYSLNMFSSLLEGKNKAVKAALLDQGNLPGVANYYLNDAFYKAKIHPKRKALTLAKGEIKTLFDSIVEVLRDAVKLKGRIERKDLYGNPGKYERLIGPKDKEKPCPNCNTLIVKLSVAGSNNYVCSNCQKLE